MRTLLRKKCRRCGQILSVTDFYKSRNFHSCPDGYQNDCCNCQRELANKRRDINNMIANFLRIKGKCKICGATDKKLHFHHRKPWEMRFRFGSRTKHSYEDIIAELEKCDLLCSSCHKLVHQAVKTKQFKNDKIRDYFANLFLHQKEAIKCPACL